MSLPLPRIAFFILVVSMLGRSVICRSRLPFFTLQSLSTTVQPPGSNSSTFPTLIQSIVDDATVVKLEEKVVFKGYRNILRRQYLLPNGKQGTYDILTQKHLSVVIFTWNTTSSTTTLIREYHPGTEQFLYGTVAGMYESSKHTSPLHASQLELEEEAQLQTDQWIPLLDSMDTSMSLDKYSTNRFFPYLALDCRPVATARPMDDDELISVEYNVPYRRVRQLLTAGQMNVVSSYAIMLGLQKLREMGIKVEE